MRRLCAQSAQLVEMLFIGMYCPMAYHRQSRTMDEPDQKDVTPGRQSGRLPYEPPMLRTLSPEEAKRVAPLFEAELRRRAAEKAKG